VFLKELHGWEHETELLDYLDSHPALRERLELETVPDQSTLWRRWNERFTRDIRETVQKAARAIHIKVQNADVAVPREPERNLPDRGHNATGSDPDDQALLDKAGRSTDHVSRVVFPAFSLDRGEGCEIREMYRQAVQQLINELAGTEEFFRAGIVAIDVTEEDPFTGDRTGHEDEIIGTEKKNDEYAYQ
jgi:hypothetical protein